MPDVALENVSKVFPSGTAALENLTLDVNQSELLVLVGPSGCGKTTTLRLIAGLEQPSSGTIRLDGKIAQHLPPAARDVALVFQRPALYPHRTVRDNLEFSLKLQQGGWSERFTTAGRQQRHQRRQRVDVTARLLGLESMLDRYPAQLSGGQQQRVALGRALVRQPSVLLLDEPLSNLDTALRQELRRELHLLQRQLGATMVYVTHDPIEALSLGDRVAVLERGRLQQVDRPNELLRRPVNRFVAGFVAWPAMNFLDGELQLADGDMVFQCCLGHATVPPGCRDSWAAFVGRPLTLATRPEDVILVSNGTANAWPMQAALLETLGQGAMVTLANRNVTLTTWVREACQIQGGFDTIFPRRHVMVKLQLEHAVLFDRASGVTIAPPATG